MQEVFEKIKEKCQKCSGIGRSSFVEFLKIIDEVAEEYNNGWIPVSERLPEKNIDVLTWARSTARGGDICFVGCCDNGAWFLQSSAGTLSYPTQYEVIAWQPLPEPYKPKGSDKQ